MNISFIVIGALVAVVGMALCVISHKTVRRLEVENKFGVERFSANGRRLAGGMLVLAGLVLVIVYFLR